MEEVEIAEMEEIVDKPKTNTTEELDVIKQNCQTIKFLGVKWYICRNAKVWFNGNDYTWSIPTYASGPGYRIFRQ